MDRIPMILEWEVVTSMVEIRAAVDLRPTVVFIDDGANQDTLKHVWSVLPHFERNFLYSESGYAKSETGWVAGLFDKLNKPLNKFPLCFIAERSYNGVNEIVWSGFGIEACTKKLLLQLNRNAKFPKRLEKFFHAQAPTAPVYAPFSAPKSDSSEEYSHTPKYRCTYIFDGDNYTLMQEDPCPP